MIISGWIFLVESLTYRTVPNPNTSVRYSPLLSAQQTQASVLVHHRRRRGDIRSFQQECHEPKSLLLYSRFQTRRRRLFCFSFFMISISVLLPEGAPWSHRRIPNPGALPAPPLLRGACISSIVNARTFGALSSLPKEGPLFFQRAASRRSFC